MYVEMNSKHKNCTIDCSAQHQKLESNEACSAVLCDVQFPNPKL